MLYIRQPIEIHKNFFTTEGTEYTEKTICCSMWFLEERATNYTNFTKQRAGFDG